MVANDGDDNKKGAKQKRNAPGIYDTSPASEQGRSDRERASLITRGPVREESDTHRIADRVFYKAEE